MGPADRTGAVWKEVMQIENKRSEFLPHCKDGESLHHVLISKLMNRTQADVLADRP